MIKEDDVVSVEMAKRLKEAGFPQDGNVFWASHFVFTKGELRLVEPVNEIEKQKMKDNGFSVSYAAPSIFELGEAWIYRQKEGKQ